jgi:hypothetical protein
MQSQLSLALTFLSRTRLRVHGPFDAQTLELVRESLTLAQSAHSRYCTGHAMVTLGDVMWGQGQVDYALAMWREALVVRAELTDRRGLASCLLRVAKAMAARGAMDAAARLFGAAATRHRELGITFRQDQEMDQRRLLETTRDALGSAFPSVWSAGRRTSLEEAVRLALSFISESTR